MKSRDGQSKRREEKKKEDHKRESLRRKKIQVREKVGNPRNTVFFQWFVAINTQTHTHTRIHMPSECSGLFPRTPNPAHWKRWPRKDATHWAGGLHESMSQEVYKLTKNCTRFQSLIMTLSYRRSWYFRCARYREPSNWKNRTYCGQCGKAALCSVYYTIQTDML